MLSPYRRHVSTLPQVPPSTSFWRLAWAILARQLWYRLRARRERLGLFSQYPLSAFWIRDMAAKERARSQLGPAIAADYWEGWCAQEDETRRLTPTYRLTAEDVRVKLVLPWNNY